MLNNHTRIYSKHTKRTVYLLATTIAIARKEQKLSETTLAEKINVSRGTIQRLEKGDLKVGIGLYFEAAWAVGIKVLTPDDASLKQQLTHNKDILQLLPKAAQPKRKIIDDNF